MRGWSTTMILVVALGVGATSADAGPARRTTTRTPKADATRSEPRRDARSLGDARTIAALRQALGQLAATRPTAGRLRTGVPTVALATRAAPGTWGRQRMSQWCWAASSQMILNYIGLPVTQESVITRAYGGYLNRPATPEEIAATLNGWVVPSGGRRYVVAAQSYDGLADAQVVADLAAQRPLIVGLRNVGGAGGHAYVLTAVSYDVDALGRTFIKSATLRDPWPDNPSAIELSWGEMNQRFVGAVRVDVGGPL